MAWESIKMNWSESSISSTKEIKRRRGTVAGSLSYTRQMVEMMNGKIEVESQENMGSLFTVSLLAIGARI